jgi:hypothetical protein
VRILNTFATVGLAMAFAANAQTMGHSKMDHAAHMAKMADAQRQVVCAESINGFQSDAYNRPEADQLFSQTKKRIQLAESGYSPCTCANSLDRP